MRRAREQSWLSGGKREAVSRPRRQNCDERKEHEQLSWLRCRPHGRSRTPTIPIFLNDVLKHPFLTFSFFGMILKIFRFLQSTRRFPILNPDVNVLKYLCRQVRVDHAGGNAAPTAARALFARRRNSDGEDGGRLPVSRRTASFAPGLDASRYVSPLRTSIHALKTLGRGPHSAPAYRNIDPT